MNCQQIQQQLDDYLDGDLELTQEADLHLHLDACEDCRQQLQQAKALIAELKQVQVPAMSPGFAQKAVSHAASQAKRRPHRNGFVAGFSSALVAGFALMFVVVGILPGDNDIESNVMPEVAISVYAPQTVNLAFDVGYAMDDATLSIDLPGNIEVVGFPGERRLSWQTSLTQGRNILPLPLKGIVNAAGELVATLEQGGKTKILRIRVRVDNEMAPQAVINRPSWV